RHRPARGHRRDLPGGRRRRAGRGRGHAAGRPRRRAAHGARRGPDGAPAVRVGQRRRADGRDLRARSQRTGDAGPAGARDRRGAGAGRRRQPARRRGAAGMSGMNGEGARRLWHELGAHPEPGGGVRFSVWAPNATRVQVDGDFGGWDMYSAVDLDCDWSNGHWSGFVPKASVADRYKFRILGADGQWRTRADPFAFRAEVPPASASVVCESDYTWGDQDWLAERGRYPAHDLFHRPMSIYEV